MGNSGFFLPLTEWAGARRWVLGPAEEPRPSNPAVSCLGEVPTFHELARGPRAREGHWFLRGTGQDGKGSHQGCWVYLLSLCGTQRCLTKVACGGQNPASALSQEGTCLSLLAGVPMGKLCLKRCVLPLTRGSRCHPCTRGVGEKPPPWCASAQKPWPKAPRVGAPHTSAAARGGSSLFKEVGTNRNEFLDCSILLPGP